MRSFKNLSLFSINAVSFTSGDIFGVFFTVSTHENKVTNSNKRSGTSLQNQNIAKSHLPTLNNQISN